MNVKLLLSTLAILSLPVFACSGDDDNGSSCGTQPVGSTCQTAAHTCVSQVCTNGSWVCPSDTTEVGVTPENCEASDASSADAGTCGAIPVGTTCQLSDGTCTSVVCAGGAYACPSGTTAVPVTPGSCTPSTDSGSDDASTCGTAPIGSACQMSDGTCSDLVCMSGSYGCPTGTTEVGLTPSNCSGVDASDAATDH